MTEKENIFFDDDAERERRRALETGGKNKKNREGTDIDNSLARAREILDEEELRNVVFRVGDEIPVPDIGDEKVRDGWHIVKIDYDNQVADLKRKIPDDEKISKIAEQAITFTQASFDQIEQWLSEFQPDRISEFTNRDNDESTA